MKYNKRLKSSKTIKWPYLQSTFFTSSKCRRRCVASGDRHKGRTSFPFNVLFSCPAVIFFSFIAFSDESSSEKTKPHDTIRFKIWSNRSIASSFLFFHQQTVQHHLELNQMLEVSHLCGRWRVASRLRSVKEVIRLQMAGWDWHTGCAMQTAYIGS